MDTMPMAGGPTISMVWMRMPGQSWAGATASFVAMWTVMMGAMMLPSLVPMLHRYRVSTGGARRAGLLTALVALGYFAVWSGLGAVVFPLGALLASLARGVPALGRAAPIVTGVVVVVTGLVQLTEWKARHLAFDQGASAHVRAMSADVGTAFRHGLRLGVHCICCCAGLTASLLALGVMDLRVMAVVTAAITAERVAGVRVARVVGVIGVVAGLFLVVR